MAEKYWTVPREWDGEMVFILGGGPSLSRMDLLVLRGRRVIAINNSWEAWPSADCLYFCDLAWWQKKAPKIFPGATNSEAVKANFSGYAISIGCVEDPRVYRLRNGGPTGLDVDPSAVRHGANSGYQAINLAYHFGAKRIALLGYDMQVEGDRTHWHVGHGMDAAHVSHGLTKRMLPQFGALVDPLRDRGVEVFNCNPASALKCWPFASVESLL